MQVSYIGKAGSAVAESCVPTRVDEGVGGRRHRRKLHGQWHWHGQHCDGDVDIGGECIDDRMANGTGDDCIDIGVGVGGKK